MNLIGKESQKQNVSPKAVPQLMKTNSMPVAGVAQKRSKKVTAKKAASDSSGSSPAASPGAPAKKTRREPHMPKKPLSAYIYFSQEVREVIKKENPSLPVAEIMKEVSTRWAAMSKAQKGPYEALAQKDKKRYEVELEVAKKRKPEGRPELCLIRLKRQEEFEEVLDDEGKPVEPALKRRCYSFVHDDMEWSASGSAYESPSPEVSSPYQAILENSTNSTIKAMKSEGDMMQEMLLFDPYSHLSGAHHDEHLILKTEREDEEEEEKHAIDEGLMQAEESLEFGGESDGNERRLQDVCLMDAFVGGHLKGEEEAHLDVNLDVGERFVNQSRI